MKYFSMRFFLIIILSLTAIISPAQKIVHYQKYLAFAESEKGKFIIIRKFELAGQFKYLAIHPDNLETEIIPANNLEVIPVSWQQIANDFKNSAYIKAIQIAKEQSVTQQDAGIVHGPLNEQGIILTIDLCPSQKPLDRIIFTSLITAFQKTETPVPLALSITGRFMISHPDDMVWIKHLIDSNEIKVTWINHSYNHKYNPKEKLNKNFLLEPGTNIKNEILQTEVTLIQNQLLPSVFFRFPGLVSNQEIVDSVLSYGLIPVGSDAWLAKGQQTHQGSIVLIHGNGNEPLGVKDFIKLLKSENIAVLNKEWLLYDLRESFENECQDNEN